MTDTAWPNPIVVGIDGSATAVQAGLWAVTEAVDRATPIRLLYAIDPTATDAEDEAHRLATAEIAVRQAYTALEATEQPVKIEVEIVQDRPIAALIRASASAAMISVGAMGFRHFADGHIGSTAEALATSAHCPVAIVRGPRHAPTSGTGWVVALIDDTVDRHPVLQAGVEEALRRNAPLRVLAQRHSGDEHAEGRLDRALDQWTHRHPGLAVHTQLVAGSSADYLAEHAAHTQLVVAGAQHHAAIRELFSAGGYAARHNTQCSLLIVNCHHGL